MPEENKPEEIKLFQRLSQARAASAREEDGNIIVDMVFATETPAYRYNWWTGDEYNEILEISDDAMNSERLIGGPFLLDHSSYSVERQIGVIESFRITGKEAICTVRFSKNREEKTMGIIKDIADGIYRNVSVGYTVEEYERTPNVKGELSTWTAKSWTPMEVSLVTIPADNNAKIRENQTAINSKHINNDKMPEDNKTPETAQQEPSTPDTFDTNVDGSRQNQILALGEAAGLLELAARHAIKKTTVEEFRKIILEHREKENPPIQTPGGNSRVAVDQTRDRKVQSRVNALLLRSGILMDSELQKEDLQAANMFRGYSLLELARMDLSARGVKTDGYSSMELAGLYLEILSQRNSTGISTSTDDFPLVYDNVVKKLVQDNYNEAAKVWREFCKVGTVSDFKKHTRIMRGFVERLKLVSETEQYQNLKYGVREQPSVSADTYGGLINMSRQMIVNDDLGVFADLAREAGIAASDTIEQLVFDALLDNTDDFFSTANGNIDTTAGPLTAARLTAMRIAMRTRKIEDSAGNQKFIRFEPKNLIADANNQADAEFLNTSEFEVDAAGNYTKKSMVRGMFTRAVDTPMLIDTNKVFVFSDITRAAAFEVAFLNGQQAPYLERREAFHQDGVEWKVRLDVGVGKINPLAAFMLTTVPVAGPPVPPPVE